MFLKQLGIVLAIVFISLILFNLIRPYILKSKIKKIHIVMLLFIFAIVPPLFKVFYESIIFQYTQMILVSLATLAFVDMLTIEKMAKKKQVIGRPKPKPRRAKNNK
ncbi:hypothetical protein SAMN05660865_01294 [Caloramator fervidus]|uniref:Uncharacterized protein n=1 Tax=Caloramator fervidus TaxID=29344 RepID=A0A1H5VSL4_9CLOT|nr:hypothetical protein [Caloramator fervidus]SEF90289.1 hypothetical protein SAMN05660865_01294 [Caloramator fervidus]